MWELFHFLQAARNPTCISVTLFLSSLFLLYFLIVFPFLFIFFYICMHLLLKLFFCSATATSFIHRVLFPRGMKGKKYIYVYIRIFPHCYQVHYWTVCIIASTSILVEFIWGVLCECICAFLNSFILYLYFPHRTLPTTIEITNLSWILYGRSHYRESPQEIFTYIFFFQSKISE